MDLLKRLEAVNSARKAAMNDPKFKASASEHERKIIEGNKTTPSCKRSRKVRKISDVLSGVQVEDRKGGQD
ncbi:hypothetical protein [Vibrio astriarenae]|uniref:hypothetical protein n=1 Tax=Vibrio astriarenae TaxID=1481923 RepID=UPI003736E336